MEERVDPRILNLVATVIDACTGPGPAARGRGHPPAATVRVVAALRRFVREGTPWRSLAASPVQASGSTLRRRLRDWARTNLLQRAHALLVGMVRGHPDLHRDLILDSCSIRAKRGGDLTGPNPTDRGKRGTKYHVAVTGDGLPVACATTAANVNDTVLFERLFLMAFAVVARIRSVFADKGYDAEANRELCRTFGAEPHVHKRGRPRGSGLEPVRKDHERVEALASRRTMSRIIPRQRKASAFRARFSKSLASRRQRPSQAKVLSTIQRLGSGTKPVLSLRFTISSRHLPILATAAAVVSPW
jgi:transposase